MNWFYWFMVGLFSLAAFANLTDIGKHGEPRKPVNGTIAACAMLLDIFVVLGILLSNGVLD